MKHLLISLLIFLILAVTIISWPANIFSRTVLNITIPSGASAREVETILKNNHLLFPVNLFVPLVKLFNLQNSLKAGTYLVTPADTLPRIIAKLSTGQTVPLVTRRVVFPEGTSIYKMGLILKESSLECWRDFQGLVNEGITAQLRQRYWNIFKYIPSESLEGYLFPDTYLFPADASAEVLADLMLKRFEQLVLPFWHDAHKATKLSLHEILTLASIIEKEAKEPKERPIIASVFYNRLNVGLPLAADPTIKYALERPSKKVYLNQLEVKSPYNTYKRSGLPPGPICNPGLASLIAVVYPARTYYLYFVAKTDGTHNFSKTWEEHQRARGLSPRQGKKPSPGR